MDKCVGNFKKKRNLCIPCDQSCAIDCKKRLQSDRYTLGIIETLNNGHIHSWEGGGALTRALRFKGCF